MENIYSLNVRNEPPNYENANPGLEHPVVFEDSAKFKDTKMLYDANGKNMPLKTYIFFLICLLFGEELSLHVIN